MVEKLKMFTIKFRKQQNMFSQTLSNIIHLCKKLQCF